MHVATPVRSRTCAEQLPPKPEAFRTVKAPFDHSPVTMGDTNKDGVKRNFEVSFTGNSTSPRKRASVCKHSLSHKLHNQTSTKANKDSSEVSSKDFESRLFFSHVCWTM